MENQQKGLCEQHKILKRQMSEAFDLQLDDFSSSLKYTIKKNNQCLIDYLNVQFREKLRDAAHKMIDQETQIKIELHTMRKEQTHYLQQQVSKRKASNSIERKVQFFQRQIKQLLQIASKEKQKQKKSIKRKRIGKRLKQLKEKDCQKVTNSSIIDLKKVDESPQQRQ